MNCLYMESGHCKHPEKLQCSLSMELYRMDERHSSTRYSLIYIYHLTNPSKNHHLNVVEGFACPCDPGSCVVRGNSFW